MYLFDDLILHLQKIKFVTFFSGKKCFAFLFWNCEVITFWQYLWSFSSPQAFDFIASGTKLCREHHCWVKQGTGSRSGFRSGSVWFWIGILIFKKGLNLRNGFRRFTARIGNVIPFWQCNNFTVHFIISGKKFVLIATGLVLWVLEVLDLIFKVEEEG